MQMDEDFLEALRSYKAPRFSGIKRRYKSIVSFPRNRYYAFRAFYQRGTRGWSDQDVWSLDDYLAKVMGESIAHLAESSHGWPGEGSEWPKFEDWQNELRAVSKQLLAYHDNHWTTNSIQEEERVYKDFVKALKRVSKYWGHLWD